MTEFFGTTALDVWKQALAKVVSEGATYNDGRDRTCIELRNVTMCIKNTQHGVLEPITILSRFEKWIYPDLQEVAKVVLSPKSASSYEYSYGKRLFLNGDKSNQIDEYVIPVLARDPQSRRAVAMLFDPVVDCDPSKKESPAMLCFDFKIRDKKLHIACMIRSNDLFIGWPANIYQIHVIQEYVAKKLGIQTGDLTTFATSAHIFGEYLDEIKRIID